MILFQHKYQQRIATLSISVSTVDSYFISTRISSRYFINTSISSRQLLHQINTSILQYMQMLLYQYHISSIYFTNTKSAVDSYFINTSISSRQLLHEYQYQQYIVESYFVNSCINSRQQSHYCWYQLIASWKLIDFIENVQAYCNKCSLFSFILQDEVRLNAVEILSHLGNWPFLIYMVSTGLLNMKKRRK